MSAPRWKPSVVVAAIVERDGRYLLVEENTSEGVRLNNPAGHLDPGESLVEAVVREVLEETTRPFVPEALVGIQLGRMQRPGDVGISFLRFAFTGTVGEPLPGRQFDPPIFANHWLTLDELRACRERHRSAFVLESIEMHHRGDRHPLALLHTDPAVWTDPQAPRRPPA